MRSTPTANALRRRRPDERRAGRASASSRRRCASPNSTSPGPRPRSWSSRSPQRPEAMALYADALWASGLFQEAEAQYRDALAASPDLARGHHGMARALAARSRLDEAMDEAQAALRLVAARPRDPPHGRRRSTSGCTSTRKRPAAYQQLRQPAAEQGPQREGRLVARRDPVPALVRAARAVRDRIRAPTSKIYTVDFRLVNDKVVVRAKVNDAPRRTSSSTPAPRTRSSRGRRRSGSASRRSPTR